MKIDLNVAAAMGVILSGAEVTPEIFAELVEYIDSEGELGNLVATVTLDDDSLITTSEGWLIDQLPQDYNLDTLVRNIVKTYPYDRHPEINCLLSDLRFATRYAFRMHPKDVAKRASE
ncbi:MAG: hypothetical protein JWO50_426 [Candidatus Kaiserbacteria bacterium]|nr:hypothetical protein [Candidatus Kaiserbacteria bacterium]